jgi:hypothetical protein
MTDSLADLLAYADELTDPRRHVEVNRCVVCPQLRTKRTPAYYERAQVCEPCRTLLRVTLLEIVDGYAVLPEHLHRGVGNAGERISGGDVEAPLPIHEDVYDLMLPVRLAVTGRAPLPDQIGYLSVATILDSWARDWATTRARSEGVWSPEVASLVEWLANRLDWACDSHPAVDEFAGEIRALNAVLRRYSGTQTPRPQPCVGVPCRRCDWVALARLADGSGDVECQNPACRTIYRPDEYQRWTRLVAGALRDSA